MMDINEQKLEHENLKSTLALLGARISELRHKVSGKETDLSESGYQMWDEITHLIRDFDDVATLSVFNEEIARQQDDYHNALLDLRNMLSLYRIPYFGRFDFISDTDNYLEKVYVGAHSFINNKTFEPYIYDWRTPIASMFYDHGVGKAQFVSPGGVESGNIVLKRRYKIRDGKMLLMYDADSTIHDNMLGSVLSENTQARLKVIIASIQQEQNNAIRYESAGDLLIFGAAGSGKTSVGLHRFAYLLYRNRERLTSKNFEIISRNALFASYISDILPELGEEDARCMLFDDIMYKLLPKNVEIETYYPQIEYVLTAPPDDIRAVGIEHKGSFEFLNFIRDYFNNFTFKMPELSYEDTVLCSAADFERRCDEMKKTRPFDAVLEHAYEYSRILYEDLFDRNKKEVLNNIWKSQGDFINDEVEEEYIRRRRDHINNAVSDIITLNGLEPLSLYIKILSLYLKNIPRGSEIIKFTELNLSGEQYLYEDAVCIAYINTLLGTYQQNLLVRQLLIDEAQDYNALQHAILKRLYPYAAFTVLADVRQSVFNHIGLKTEEELVRLYPGNHSISLDCSYRSTGPICELASKLSRGKMTDFFDRDGEKPQLFRGKSAVSSIDYILQIDELAEYGNIGIICSTSARAGVLHKQLLTNTTLIIDPERELTKGTVIIPAALSKGLEFDAVIIDCSDINDPNMLYLLCTRALHRLYIVCEDEIPPPLVPLEGFWVERGLE